MHTMLGPPSDQFHRTLYGSPSYDHITLFGYYMGPPSDLFLRILYVSRILHGDPLRSVSLHTIVGPLISFFFFAYDMGPHQSTFFAYNIGILVRLVSQYMPIAIVMKMRKMFYFYISMDSRVKIGCFLNNIVVIAQKNISSISKWRLNHCTSFWFQASGFFSKQKFWKISPIPEHWKIQSFL